MKTMLALALCVLILGANQVASNDCCAADQYSVEFAETLVQVFNSESQSYGFNVKGESAMDYTGHRYAFNLTWHDYDQKQLVNTRYIYLYNEGTSFEILNDTQCYKTSPSVPEPSQCLPDDAVFDDTIVFGENSMQLNSWKINIDEQGGFHGEFRLATTQANCIPVVSSMIGSVKTDPGEYDHFVADSVLFNYTNGLGPSAFTVPDICNNATLKLKDKPVERLDKWNFLRKGMVFF